MKNYLLIALTLFAAACSSSFSGGSYNDPDQVILLSDQFSENDFQKLTEDIIKQVEKCQTARPTLVVEEITNKTEEVNTFSFRETLENELIRKGFRLVAKSNRSTISEELDYQTQSGRVNQSTVKSSTSHIGAESVLTGTIRSNIQQVDSRKLTFYILTVQLTSLTTGTIECSAQSSIRKAYKKR